MKFISAMLIPILLLSSCVSLVPERKLKEWAYARGFILASECPKITIPERPPQPHPSVPSIIVYDSSGKPIELTKAYLMEIIISLFGTVEKYQYLVEIYEREYLNAGGQIMPNLTLEELKKLYLSRLSKIEAIIPPTKRTTGSSSVEQEMTVEQFANLLKIYNALGGL